MKRRTLLQGTLAFGALGMALSAGLLTPRAVLAAWPKDAFDAKAIDAALKNLFGAMQLEDNDKIALKLPKDADNSAAIPVSMEVAMDGVESISLIAENNARPLIASFTLGATTAPYISTRIKLSKTSRVIAVVKVGGKLYSASNEVKVTAGGCAV